MKGWIDKETNERLETKAGALPGRRPAPAPTRGWLGGNPYSSLIRITSQIPYSHLGGGQRKETDPRSKLYSLLLGWDD